MTARFESVLRFAHRYRRRTASVAYALLTAFGLWSAFHLRFELNWPAGQEALFWASLPWLVGIRVLFGYGLSLHEISGKR